MTHWVCPSCGNQFESDDKPSQCPGCDYVVTDEVSQQFSEIGTEETTSADEAFELIDDAVSTQANKTVDVSSSDAKDFSQTVDLAATVRNDEDEGKRLSKGEATVDEDASDAGAGEVTEIAEKTFDAAGANALDFSQTVDASATVKEADDADVVSRGNESTGRATLPDLGDDNAFEVIDDEVAAAADKAADPSSSDARASSKTVGAAATADEQPETSDRAARATLPDGGEDESFELLDKTSDADFEKTIDTSTVREDGFPAEQGDKPAKLPSAGDVPAQRSEHKAEQTVRATADEPTGQEPSDLIDKTLNVAVAKTFDARGFAEDPEYYQTQKTISETSQRGTVSSLSEMPTRVLASSDNSKDLSDYQLEKELGKGSFGVVWRARQKALNRTVALKLLHEKGGSAKNKRDQTVVETQEQIRRRTEFLREAQFNGRLDHPNIVPIHELGIGEDGSPFYAMKEIRGISWREVIGEKTLQENIDILRRVADAMSFAHSRDILHCDLKPDNVMLGEFGEVLVVDWGQAIDLADPETFRPGGSPVYIPPEMAQYFCDTILAKEASASRSLVGKRSDTYLLGAILFEIVTGFPPHPCAKGDTISDVLRRAAKNEVRDHSDFADDELMQIALEAMGANDRKRYETVTELQDALHQYDSRQRSIEARIRAEEELAEAKIKKNYDAFQKARFGFEEAIELWPENLPAQRGLGETRLSFATLALENQDFDLGIGQLGKTESAAESELKVQLFKGRRVRDRRKKLIGALLLTVAAAVVIGLATNSMLITKNIATKSEANAAVAKAEGAEERQQEAELKAQEFESKAADAEQLASDAATKAKAAEQSAMDAKMKADAAEDLAKAAEQKAKVAETLAKDAEQKASDFQILALDAETKAREAEAKAKDAKEKADSAKMDLVQAEEEATSAREEAKQAREEAKLVRFKNVISNIDRRISAGEYETAYKLLQDVEDRDWEWGRLMLLSHPEVQTLNPGLIRSQALSGNGQSFALVTPLGVRVRKVSDFALVQEIPVTDASAIALSQDASQLAIASNGMIRIFDVASAKVISSLSAQSGPISHLEFSSTSERLLSVGEPDPASKGDRRNGESDLMVWQQDSNGWSRVRFVSGDGKVMSSARFSFDGNRIVTAGDRAIHVLAFDPSRNVYQREAGFSYAAKNYPVINVAVFADSKGKQVMCGCEDSSIVLWNVDYAPGIARQPTDEESSPQFVKASANEPLEVVAVQDVFPGHSRSVLSLAIVGNQEGKGTMVSAGDDGTILRWNLADKTTEEFRGHATSIGYCGITLDGQTILSVSSGIDSHVRKIDLNAYNDELITLATQGRALVSGSESPATKGMIFGSNDGRVYAYEGAPSAKLLADWSVSPRWKRHLAAGDRLFSESSENSIYVWNVDTGNLERLIDGLPSFKLFDVSHDGQTVVSLRMEGEKDIAKIDVWDVEKGELTRTISGPAGQQLSSLAISPNGEWVVGGYSGLFVWSTQTGKRRYETTRGVSDPQGTVDAITFLGNTNRFIAAWNQDWLRVFDAAGDSGKVFEDYRHSYQKLVDADLVDSQQYALLKSAKGFEVLALAADGKFSVAASIASGIQARFSDADASRILIVNSSEDTEAVVAWDWRNGEKHSLSVVEALSSKALNFPEFAIEQIEETADGRLLVEARGHLVALSVDLQTQNLHVVPQAACMYAAFIGKDRAVTLHGEGDGKVRFWKFAGFDSPRLRVSPDGQLSGTFSHCQISPDERHLVAVNEPGNVLTVFDLTQHKIVGSLDLQTSVITAVCWSSDATEIATGLETGNAIVWEFVDDVDGKRLVKKHELTSAHAEHPGAVRAISMDREANKILLISGSDASVYRKTVDGWIGIVLPQNAETVTGDISPDGKRVVTASNVGSITVWNAEEIEKTSQDGGSDLPNLESKAKERVLLELYQHKSEVRFVKFSLDGKSLISAEAGAAER